MKLIYFNYNIKYYYLPKEASAVATCLTLLANNGDIK